MYKQTTYTDCTININDKQYHLHKNFISDKSQLIGSQLNNTNNLVLEDISEYDFQIILDYCYTKNTQQINNNNIFTILTFSNKYKIKDLEKFCLNYIFSNLSIISVDILDKYWYILKNTNIKIIINYMILNIKIKNLFTKINSLENFELKKILFSIIDEQRNINLLNKHNNNLFSKITSIYR